MELYDLLCINYYNGDNGASEKVRIILEPLKIKNGKPTVYETIITLTSSENRDC